MQLPSIQYKKWLRNKYFIATVVFILLLLFGDRNNLFNQYEYRKQFGKAKNENEYYKKEILRIQKEHDQVFGTEKSLEKFAREKYLMKRDDEDVFLIIKK